MNNVISKKERLSKGDILSRYKRYFDFLRYSLNPTADAPTTLEGMDWQALYRFGEEQALLGVLCEGIKRLPKGTVEDTRLLARWTLAAQKISQRNHKAYCVAAEMQRQLTSDNIRSCILKGQGNALLYPNPQSRTPGDIDIWIMGKTRRQIMEYCQSRFIAHGKGGAVELNCYHIMFFFKTMRIEMHFIPGIANNPFYNHRLHAWYTRQGRLSGASGCCMNVSLPHEGGQISLPTAAFNLVYQLAHLYYHFFGEGIGMRQIVDYHQLIRCNEQTVAASRAFMENDLRRLGLRKFAGAVMWVLEATLHLPTELMLTEPDARRGEVLLEEILNGGNFGRHDTKYGGMTRQPIGRRYFTRLRRSLAFAKLYPSEALCEPLFRTWHFLWRVAHKKAVA